MLYANSKNKHDKEPRRFKMSSFTNLGEAITRDGEQPENINFVEEGPEIRSKYCMKFVEIQKD